MFHIQQNILLKNYTTFKIGGLAKFFVKVENEEELKDALGWAKENGQPVFVLAGGSNVLVSDNGFDGLIIKMNNKQLKVNNNIVSVGVGINLSNLIEKCLQNKLVGLENLIGIPGTVGGAVYGNAGAWGSSISNFIKSVTVFSKEKIIMEKFSKVDCQFDYRTSIFKNDKFIIWSVELELEKGDIKVAQQRIKQILAKRYKVQPSYPSAGCIFKNIKGNSFDELIESKISFQIPQEYLDKKAIPAGWMIEEVGLKGKPIGGAQVSEQHANFIINTGTSTAEDVIKLISLIKTRVRDKFNLQLPEEIKYVGFLNTYFPPEADKK